MSEKIIIITGGFELLPFEYAPNCVVEAGKIIVGEKPDRIIYENAMSFDSIPFLPEGVTYNVI